MLSLHVMSESTCSVLSHALFGIGGLRARPAQDVAQIFLKDRRILEVWRAGNHIIGRHHRGRKRTETINRLAGDVVHLVNGVECGLVLRAIDRLKHATAQHMVPVYACLLITQAGCLIVAIKKHRAGRIGAPVEEPVEIGAVVFTLHNGIVDRGTGDVDPPHHIGIDGGQLIKIDARYARAIRVVNGGILREIRVRVFGLAVPQLRPYKNATSGPRAKARPPQ